MIMESPTHSITRYNFHYSTRHRYPRLHRWGSPFSMEVGLGGRAPAQRRSWPDCTTGSRHSDGGPEREHQMPGSHLKFVRTLDFDVLDGLGARAAAEIRAA